MKKSYGEGGRKKEEEDDDVVEVPIKKPKIKEKPTNEIDQIKVFCMIDQEDLKKVVNGDEVEREKLLDLLRKTEVKWAKRCLVAFSILALSILVVVLNTVFTIRCS